MKEINTLDMVNQIRELAEYIDSLQDRIKELEEINEEHKKINGELRATIKANETILMLYKDNTDLINNRINKAIEILESKKHTERLFGGVEGETFTEKAINILKGEDKE